MESVGQQLIGMSKASLGSITFSDRACWSLRVRVIFDVGVARRRNCREQPMRHARAWVDARQCATLARFMGRDRARR
jgi:hypothetical protein